MKDFIDKATPGLPLKIEHISWDETVLVLSGEGWGFNTFSAWRISDNKGMLVGCYDQHAMVELEKLRNTLIIKIETQSDRSDMDPAFYLACGKVVEIFSTTVIDSWVMSVDSYAHTGFMP